LWGFIFFFFIFFLLFLFLFYFSNNSLNFTVSKTNRQAKKIYGKENSDVDLYECFSTSEVEVKNGYYFGFQATTGNVFDQHDVKSLYINTPVHVVSLEEDKIQKKVDISQNSPNPPQNTIDLNIQSSSIDVNALNSSAALLSSLEKKVEEIENSIKNIQKTINEYVANPPFDKNQISKQMMFNFIFSFEFILYFLFL
jgi:hypothetical protein